MGPLWLDVTGFELDAEEREMLAHPTVGGVILFSRNYHDRGQLLALNESIRKAAKRPILIGVDQEGGRVQRFKEGFSRLPPAALYHSVPEGEKLAELGGWLMAAELVAHDIDLSFAPVLDKGYECRAIGNRAFGEDVKTIIAHSSAFMRGMKSAGMATTGKHFPGHGGVVADSHLETPYDHRDSIMADMEIFRHQIEHELLDAMMPAHVIYPAYDSQPASGSKYWLQDVLRRELNFRGVVFSDDLSMEGAAIMGGPTDRAQQALEAGCDMLLMCNNRNSAVEVLDHLPITEVDKAMRLRKTQSIRYSDLVHTTLWKAATAALAPYCEQ
ncbi:beta-N-acetylhexosaminidase [Vibrio nitrifigilis]|uniref:Beta-hexosaminidase n=1 Tax=Vibrio nitrifigilis TaxID=2789781 RepID=A0ABS0G9V4_9VIBR|nr:beta-N-acetylhexosaminidase [Vibrio nitrifigilis]MBF8999193.1 beta-N-acetylhexosaminidase [Vibrio nitrifigilis]